FESEEYTPMAISGAGDWTVYDGDGVVTYNVFREYYNPYQTQAMAFQLFDNVVAEVPEAYQVDAEAHSGQRFMLAPSAQSADNDNWLISPRLSGNAQTVTFYAKSYTITWPETFSVYYSVGDNSVESFTAKVDDVTGFTADGEVPETWTLFTVNLPEGATYFAINHDSYDSLALFVDDVTYEAAPAMPEDLAVTGYYVFRNGEQLTAEPIAEVTYTDTPIAAEEPAGDYELTYTVVPVYNYGIAAVSNAATVTVSHSGVAITVADAEADSAVYYNMQGMRVASGEMTPGIYIRVAGDKAAKVAVK
ncbi:MAG: choice-of-anchor J domain-containing protein, partial [Muribaculaceae bacterium]